VGEAVGEDVGVAVLGVTTSSLGERAGFGSKKSVMVVLVYVLFVVMVLVTVVVMVLTSSKHPQKLIPRASALSPSSIVALATSHPVSSTTIDTLLSYHPSSRGSTATREYSRDGSKHKVPLLMPLNKVVLVKSASITSHIAFSGRALGTNHCNATAALLDAHSNCEPLVVVSGEAVVGKDVGIPLVELVVVGDEDVGEVIEVIEDVGNLVGEMVVVGLTVVGEEVGDAAIAEDPATFITAARSADCANPMNASNQISDVSAARKEANMYPRRGKNN